MKKFIPHKILNFLFAMRISHYIKNGIIFIPSFFNLGVSINYLDLIIAFFSLSFAASAGYLFNDLNDINHDRNNHIKKNRILIGNKISLTSIKIISVILIILSISLSIMPNIKIFNIILFYIFLTYSYTLVLKKIVYIDLLFLSLFYVIRILLGVIISGQDITIWLILLSIIFFLNFSSIKRLVDINNYIKKNKNQVYNLSSKNNLKKLIKLLSIILPIVSFIYLFLDSFIFTQIKIGIFLIFIVSLWNIYIGKLAFKNKIKRDFILFILTNPISQIAFLLSTLLLIINIYLSYL